MRGITQTCPSQLQPHCPFSISTRKLTCANLMVTHAQNYDLTAEPWFSKLGSDNAFAKPAVREAFLVSLDAGSPWWDHE